MTLPLVISASKIHAVQMKNLRKNYMSEEYKPRFTVNTVNSQDLKKTKANLCNNSKSLKTTRKKCKGKRKSGRSKNSTVRLTDCSEATRGLYITKDGKNKSNQGKRNSSKLSTTVEKTSKNAIKNQESLSSSPSVVFCAIKRIASSHGTKRCPAAKLNSARKIHTTSFPRRPRISSTKHTSPKQVAEFDIKRQSCPPAPIQPQSPTRKETVRIRKVYYSEAQSQMLAGVPRVPPATPLNDHFIAVEIVPCMEDVKSQQAIKTKLRNLELQRQKEKEKLRDKFLKEEKRREKEQRESVKQQQRAEIYALNKVMTDYEHKKFWQFMKERNNGTTISLKV